MQTFLIVIQIIVALGMIGLILLQRSEGGGLVQSGGGGGGMMSTRTTANLLTKLTSIFAAIFMGICLLQAIIASQGMGKKSIIQPLTTPIAPVEMPVSSTPSVPAETTPVAPAAPVKQAPEKKAVPTKAAPKNSANKTQNK